MLFRSWRRTRSGVATATGDAVVPAASPPSPASPSAGGLGSAPTPNGADPQPFPVWTVELLPGGIIWIVTPLAVFERRAVNTWVGYWMVWPPPVEAEDSQLAGWLEDEARRWVAAELNRRKLPH